MTTSTEPNNVWAFMNKPAANDASQATKKTYVTNYVKGQSADLSLPEIATGGVAPFIIGRDIIKSPDMIWYGNLQPIYEIKTEQQTVTDPDTNVETITTTVTATITNYTVDIQFCAGLGPGVRLRSILLDNVPVWTGTIGPARTDFVVANNDIIKDVTFAGGNFDQAIDTYLQSKIPQALTAYRGVAYVVLKALDTTKLGNLSFEVDRYPDPLAITTKNKIGDDINTVSAIAEIITRKWGGAGRDPATLGASFVALANATFDAGNGCSLISRQVNSANDLNGILLDQLDATLWEDHELGTIEITQYNKNFDRTNLVRIFDKDIFKIDQMQKTGWSVIPTSLSLTYVDRAQNYGEIPIATRNLATSSKITKSIKSLSFPAVRSGALAAQILAREGASAGSPVQQITLTTNRKTAGLNPGDIVLITYEDYGYYSLPGIVVKRRTQPVDDNSVTLLVNVILYPNNTVLFAAPESSFFVPVDPNPHAPLLVKALSAPWGMRAGSQPTQPPLSTSVDLFYVGEVQTDSMFILSNGYNNTQQFVRGHYRYSPSDDYITFYSNGGTTVVNGVITPNATDFNYPAYGKLTTPIDKYDNWDGSSVTETIVINAIGAQNGELKSIASGLARGIAFDVYIFIDDEIFKLSTIRDPGNADMTYNEALKTATFTCVRRAVYDTVAQSHNVGADVFIITNRSGYASGLGIYYAQPADLVFTGTASPKDVYSESNIAVGFAVTHTGLDRANRPLRPHNTKIDGARDATPHALTLGASSTISWLTRGRNRKNTDQKPYQLDAAQPPEINGSSEHVAYRVFILDSAAVLWDCGATANTADHASLAITVPALAAAGVGWLYVQAEYNPGSGLKTSLYQDRLPVTLS